MRPYTSRKKKINDQCQLTFAFLDVEEDRKIKEFFERFSMRIHSKYLGEQDLVFAMVKQAVLDLTDKNWSIKRDAWEWLFSKDTEGAKYWCEIAELDDALEILQSTLLRFYPQKKEATGRK
jgi:hypothetical protein